MNEWYRDKLGVTKNKKVNIAVSSDDYKWQKKIQASLMHPDSNARLATYLACISIFLGLVGFVLGLISLYIAVKH